MRKRDFTESLSNLALSLKLFLTVCVSVALCERSFSKLKLIKNYFYLHQQSRLSNLALLSIEPEVAGTTNFDVVMNDLASVRSRSARF